MKSMRKKLSLRPIFWYCKSGETPLSSEHQILVLEGFPPARLSEESICLPCPTDGVWLGSTDRDSHCRVLRLGEEVLHTTSYCLLGRSSPYNLHPRSRHPSEHSVHQQGAQGAGALQIRLRVIKFCSWPSHSGASLA